jgi:hypothetical protein
MEPNPENAGADPSAPPLPPDGIPTLTEGDLVLRREENGAFLFDPETSALHCLNDVGILVWESIDGRSTVAEISRHIAEKFDDVEEDSVLKDVTAFLGDILSMGYMTLAGNKD